MLNLITDLNFTVNEATRLRRVVFKDFANSNRFQFLLRQLIPDIPGAQGGAGTQTASHALLSVFTGSCPEYCASLKQSGGRPRDTKCQEAYAGVSQSLFSFPKILSCEDPGRTIR